MNKKKTNGLLYVFIGLISGLFFGFNHNLIGVSLSVIPYFVGVYKIVYDDGEVK